MQNYDIKDLLTVKSRQTKNSYTLEVDFGLQYQEAFGDTYYSVWTKLDEREPIFLIKFDKDLSYFPEYFEGKGDVLLSHFYFNPSKYRENDMGGDRYWKLLTQKERKFYKGMGFRFLCKAMTDMFAKGFIQKGDFVLLEASGGNSAKDMENLVKYYKTLGFKPHTTDKKILQDAYEDISVPMIVKASELYNKCK